MVLSILIVSASYLLLYSGTRFLVNGLTRPATESNNEPDQKSLIKLSFLLSVPAFFIEIAATLHGAGGILAGSIIGSNMFNLCLVLGISAFLIPLQAHQKPTKLLFIFLIASTLIFIILFNDRSIDRQEGIFLLVFLVSFAGFNLYRAKDNNIPNLADSQEKEENSSNKKTYRFYARVLLSLLSIAAGSWLLIIQSSWLAGKFGISTTLFGLTFVSVGVSIPVMVSTLKAASAGKGEMALVLVVWTSIINILGVTALAAIIRPFSAMAISNFDLYASIGITVLQLQFLHRKYRLRKDEALFMVCIYLIFIYYLLPK